MLGRKLMAGWDCLLLVCCGEVLPIGGENIVAAGAQCRLIKLKSKIWLSCLHRGQIYLPGQFSFTPAKHKQRWQAGKWGQLRKIEIRLSLLLIEGSFNKDIMTFCGHLLKRK